jgi:uncharacterized protein (DUF433 family)
MEPGMATDVQLTDDELIERYIATLGSDQVSSEARLAESGISVWVLMWALRRGNGNISVVAREHSLSSEAVEAAIAYYLRHRRVIDAQVVLHAEQHGAELSDDVDLIKLVEDASPSSRLGIAARAEEALIQRHVARDGYGRGGANSVLADSGVPIWALVGHLPTVDFDLERLTQDYNLTEDAVQAAMAFYRRNTCVLDARASHNIDIA